MRKITDFFTTMLHLVHSFYFRILVDRYFNTKVRSYDNSYLYSLQHKLVTLYLTRFLRSKLPIFISIYLCILKANKIISYIDMNISSLKGL